MLSEIIINLVISMLLNDPMAVFLRPRREIRELTWADFSEDLKYIHLSGNRNRSGRNRIDDLFHLMLEIYL